ncbi:CHAT domain-containing protein [Phenylobacterium sp.]|uniref:CHAT domain-containing protein n=1 Tax=Phenylobacterium sp. TaxID=1871053 RepID=UPI0025CDF941|nr:CHAT domain-containing protein [Phenylobacterium sp.]
MKASQAARDALGPLAGELAEDSPDHVHARWPHFARLLHGAAEASRWHYVALLCLAALVDEGELAPTAPEYIDSLVFNHRINEALYFKLYHDRLVAEGRLSNRPLRSLRLPARRWNLPNTDCWVSCGDVKSIVVEVAEEAAAVGADARPAWISHALSERLGELNDRLKDAAVMQMMRHAGALNGMQWRRLTKSTSREVVHVRLHAASGMLTTTIRVGGGSPQRKTHALPLLVLPRLSEFEAARFDSHFGVRALGRLVFDALVALRDRSRAASEALESLQWFYDQLLAPLFAKRGVAGRIAELGERPTLVVTTHGALAQLPFAALHDKQCYLGERFNVVQAPPLFPEEDFATGDIDWDSMQGGEPLPQGLPVRGMFNPDLPEARTEAVNLRRHFGVRASLSEGDWDIAALRQLTRGRGLAFLSSHIDPSEDGVAGAMLRTPDKRALAFTSILGEPMAADLLVLAGCISTAQSDWLADGENSLVSLYRRAGVASVISTLWPVDDRATRLYTDALMAALATGRSRAQAHGEAQRQVMGAVVSIGQSQERLIRQPSVGADAIPAEPQMAFDHPYFWGAFTLAGAWR